MIRKLCCLITMVLVLSIFQVPSSALTVEQLRELLRDNYLEEVPESILSLPTVSEMLTALGDPYTRYLSAEEFATMMSWFEDSETTSLGVTLAQHDLGWMITKVYQDSGAEAAEIQPGEVITQVNGVSVAGKDLGEAAALLEGDAGTLLPVALLDASGEARQVTVTLRPFIILTTEFYENSWLTEIYCAAFGEDTTKSFDEGIRKYDEKTDVWMLDMRANNGGFINAAVETANLLVGHAGETLASFQWRTGEIDALSGGRERLTAKPIVTVVSQNTISSGEIFVGILRDLDVGITVGMRTHGKGITQIFLTDSVLPGFFQDGDALQFTINRNYTYSGTTTHRIGVIPDLLVSDEVSIDAADLLCERKPVDSKDYIRITLQGRESYYVSIAYSRKSEELPRALTAIIEALPPSAEVCVGAGGDKWTETDVADVAQLYCPDYVSRAFADVSDSAHRKAINTLSAYALLSGGGDGRFRPDDTMTRAELCAAVGKVLNVKETAAAAVTFSDVPTDAWYAGSVEVLQRLGIVDGFSDGTFRPDAPVTQEQLMTVCAKLGAWLNLGLQQTYDDIASGTPSVDMTTDGIATDGIPVYPAWCETHMEVLAHHDLLPDGFGERSPSEAVTREVAADLLYRLLYHLGILGA